MSRARAKRCIRAIDLFCGAGGSSWGARAAGVKIVAAFDQWKVAGQVYQDNFPGTRFFGRRLENITAKSVAKEFGRIDLILASPECTNHSPAKGKRRRCEKSKATAFQVIRFARVLKPRWIVIENVSSMRRWRRYEEFKEKLRSLGYHGDHLREQFLNAADFGVPQSRRRLFIVCDRERQPPAIPKRTPKRRRKKAREVVNLNGVFPWSPLRAKGRAKATLQRAKRAITNVGQRSPFLIVYYGSDHAGGWQRLSVPLRTITTLDRFAIVKRQNGSHVMRMLQVPELKAAMGMGRMHLKRGTRRDRIKMIGNAVCPPVMTKVIRHLLAGTTAQV